MQFETEKEANNTGGGFLSTLKSETKQNKTKKEKEKKEKRMLWGTHTHTHTKAQRQCSVDKIKPYESICDRTIC
jgi:hypothetical protein